MEPNQVDLWIVDLDRWPPPNAACERLLSVDERERARRFHFEVDRRRFVAARAALRLILASYVECAPDTLVFEYGEWGKPFLCDARFGLHFNLSHSANVAIYGITRDRRIGVDVEQVRELPDLERIATQFFSDVERRELFTLPPAQRTAAFFKCWTCKEAYVKARGEGLSVPLREFDVSVAPGRAPGLLQTRPDPREATRWSLQTPPMPPGFAAAIVVEGHDWTLTHRTPSCGVPVVRSAHPPEYPGC
jgi:4'-phosphopantetheinyl transferase